MKNIFYIMGTGPSINDITDEEWRYLEDKHTISFAGFPYSDKKTEYYFSIEREHIDKRMLDIMARNGFLDTKLLLYIFPSIEHARKLNFIDIKKVYKQNSYFLPSRKPWFTDEEEPPHKFIESRAKNFRQIIFRFRGQLSAVINASLILGATEIKLCGIDLNCQKNFFETEYQEGTNPRWVKSEYIKEIYKTLNEGSKERLSRKKQQVEMFKDYDEKNIHTTELLYVDSKKFGDRKLRPISEVIQWMDKELRDEGMEGIFITNKKSKLYTDNKLEYREIMDE